MVYNILWRSVKNTGVLYNRPVWTLDLLTELISAPNHPGKPKCPNVGLVMLIGLPLNHNTKLYHILSNKCIPNKHPKCQKMPNKSQRPCYLKHFSAEHSGWNAAAHFGFDLLWHWPWKMHLTWVLNIPEAAKDMVGLLWKLCQNKFAIGAIGNAEHSRECPNEDDRRPQYNKSNSYAGKHTFGNISYMCTTRDKYFCFAFSLSINRVITLI